MSTLTHVSPAFLVKTAAFTIGDREDVVLANGTFTVTLPTAATGVNHPLTVKNIGTGTITISANGTELIDSATTFALAKQYDTVVIVSDGTQWWRVRRVETFANAVVTGTLTVSGNATFSGTLVTHSANTVLNANTSANSALRCDTTNGRLVIPVGTGKYAT